MCERHVHHTNVAVLLLIPNAALALTDISPALAQAVLVSLGNLMHSLTVHLIVHAVCGG